MSGATTIRITLACAYCDGVIDFRQGHFELRGERGLKVARDGQVTTLQCPHCGSSFSVHMETKRKRQGAGYKALLAKRAAEHARKVEDAIARNLAVAERLLSQNACTCGISIARLQADEAARRYREHGHAFSARAITYGIPTVPHHDRTCPCYGGEEEAAIRGAAGATS